MQESLLHYNNTGFIIIKAFNSEILAEALNWLLCKFESKKQSFAMDKLQYLIIAFLA